ncbi:MAG: SAM-dependent methyltransferase [Planctomycetota bacterium]
MSWSRRKRSKSNREHRQAFADSEFRAEVGADQWSEHRWESFVDSLSVRHQAVRRYRRDHNPERLDGQPVAWYPSARRDEPNGNTPASRTLEYASGQFYLQDAGSLLALAACLGDHNSINGQIVCDLCAAPGGKASGLLEAVGTTGFVLACEPIASRIAPLATNLARTGSGRYAIGHEDPETIAAIVPGCFDLVLVDAPCSGQAMMGRGKQSVGAASKRSIALNAARQRRILDAAAKLVRPGGRLVYSTCTFGISENESQIRHLIESGPWQPDPVAALEAYQTSGMPGCYRLWPHEHDCAGAFAASLIKAKGPVSTSRSETLTSESQQTEPNRSMPSSSTVRPWKYRDGSLPDSHRPSPEARQAMRDVFGDVGSETLIVQRDWVIDAMVNDHPPWLAQLPVQGPECLHRTGQTWRPSHAAALRRDALACSQRLSLDDTQAAAYMCGETITAALLAGMTGWCVVTWRDRPLGWIKSDGRVGKNHLPGHVRYR